MVAFKMKCVSPYSWFLTPYPSRIPTTVRSDSGSLAFISDSFLQYFFYLPQISVISAVMSLISSIFEDLNDFAMCEIAFCSIFSMLPHVPSHTVPMCCPYVTHMPSWVTPCVFTLTSCAFWTLVSDETSAIGLVGAPVYLTGHSSLIALLCVSECGFPLCPLLLETLPGLR